MLIATIVLAIILMCGAFAYSAASYGIVISLAWKWFMIPLGLSPISIWHAAGIAMFVGLLTTKSYTYVKDEEERTKIVVGTLLQPWLALVFMYIIYLFMSV